MSARKDIRDGIKTAIEGLLPGTPVRIWEGEDQAFNQEHLWPAVFVSYDGIAFGSPLELGGPTTYNRQFLYNIYVCARGQDAAMDILETIETGLSGQSVAGGYGPLELIEGEGLVASSMDRHLYVQQWSVNDMESH